MTIVQQMASFITNAKFSDLSAIAREHLKIRILDSLRTAFGAIGAEPIRAEL